ncbi:MAG: murein L,D-transpeptidase [Desulfobulbaceae bacterium]|nr:murein L,D-transpeptidase [Desulfobulbaceae bacterium]
MYFSQRLFIVFFILLIIDTTVSANAMGDTVALPLSDRVMQVFAQIGPDVDKDLRRRGFEPGSKIFIRIFKLEKNLQLWIEKNGRFALYKNYPICQYSGRIGPKLREGDRQSPEGFYSVTAADLNPWSENHLSFNIGYPNEYDRLLKRTGSAIMVHGGCTSVGCFAMGDYRIEEIYYLAHLALENGQESFDVHIFPFVMLQRNFKCFANSPWIPFWRNLKIGYDHFERYNQLPFITATEGKYIITGGVRVAMNSNSSTH